jgi:hypothetical protein
MVSLEFLKRHRATTCMPTWVLFLPSDTGTLKKVEKRLAFGKKMREERIFFIPPSRHEIFQKYFCEPTY